MAFFPKHEVKGFTFKPRKDIKATKFYDGLAQKLLDYLFRNDRIPKSMKGQKKLLHQGAAILSLIVERDLDGKRSHLEKVVKDFCMVVPDEFTPVVWNITDFWMKFKQIEKWLEQRSEFINEESVSQDARKIYKHLLEWRPNEHVRKCLLDCIEKSFENYASMIDALLAIRRKGQRYSSEAAYVLEYHFGESRKNNQLIMDWFTWLFPTYDQKRWEAWEPTPFQLTFSTQSYHFRKFYHSVVGNTMQLSPLVKEIQLESRKLRRQGRASNTNGDDSK